ncbi:MAG: helix-turn-helix transcriptional regulator [Synergistaceae bacterium]|nr:helix-turn-helix transcriptional regulator [Synergistaceae bacterium]
MKSDLIRQDVRLKLAAELNDLMKERGIKAAELARRLNISRARLWNYIHGRNVPDMSILTAIARELGVSVDYMLTGVNRADAMGLRLKRYWLGGLEGGGTPTPPLD